MTELKLYKFIHDNDLEWHRYENDGTPDVIILVDISELQEFSDLVKSYTTDEEIAIILKDGYVAIWMKDLCEHYNIEMNNVFVGEEC